MATQLFQVQIRSICNSWPTIVPKKCVAKWERTKDTIFQKESSTHMNSRALTYSNLNHLNSKIKQFYFTLGFVDSLYEYSIQLHNPNSRFI